MTKSQIIEELAERHESIATYYKAIEYHKKRIEDLQWELDQMEDEDE